MNLKSRLLKLTESKDVAHPKNITIFNGEVNAYVRFTDIVTPQKTLFHSCYCVVRIGGPCNACSVASEEFP